MTKSLDCIYEYDINNLLLYIASFSSTPFSLIKQKYQIIYLDNYLNQLIDKDESIFFVYESQYVDKYYLDDYTQYYAKCFNSYSKYTSRIHFFKHETSKGKPEETLKNFKQKFYKTIVGEGSISEELQKDYLGFMVVRPILNTFISNISLKTVGINSNKILLTKRYDVNLYGIKLFVDTIPMQEQDRVVSACATVALWTFYHASKIMCRERIPSPSSITKSAFSTQEGLAREFPSNGLSPAMMLKSIKQNHCSPDFFDKNPLEHIYAFISNGIPILLSVEVRVGDNPPGYHAVTVLGCQLDDKLDKKYAYQKITHLYLHDDRYGAYVLAEIQPDDVFKIMLYKNEKVSNIAKNFEEEIYKPISIIVGTYSKIRVRYNTIKKIAIELDMFLSYYIQKSNNKNIEKIYNAITWDITLQENIKVKEQIKQSNMSDEKKFEYLVKSWPKNIWSIKLHQGQQLFLELLFDATDIDQGDFFIDFISHKQEAEIWIEIIKVCLNRFEQIICQNNMTNKTSLWPLYKYFYKSQKSSLESLDSLYGYTSIPKYIKESEIECDYMKNNIEFKLNSISNKELDKNLKNDMYIWVVDKDGYLCIGKEEKNSNMGHPTLTDGMPSRIGGELKYDSSKQCWLVNYASGRYTKGLYEPKEAKVYLSNVVNLMFKPFFPREKFSIEE